MSKEQCFYFCYGKCFKEQPTQKCNGMCGNYIDGLEAEAQLEIAIKRHKAYMRLLKLEEKTKKERKEYIEKINKKNF